MKRDNRKIIKRERYTKNIHRETYKDLHRESYKQRNTKRKIKS